MSVDMSQVANEAALQGLRAFDEAMIGSGFKKNDRADMLIIACIGEGIIAGSMIVATLVKLGFDRQHVGIRLAEGLHAAPEWPNWGRSEGRYYLPLASVQTT